MGNFGVILFGCMHAPTGLPANDPASSGVAYIEQNVCPVMANYCYHQVANSWFNRIVLARPWLIRLTCPE